MNKRAVGKYQAYPEYKDSGCEWIRIIPKHWLVSKLKYYTNQIVDGAHFTPTYVDTGVAFLRVTDVQSKYIDKNIIKFIPQEEHNELIKRCNPKRGDLLLSKNGTIGIPKIVDWDWEFSIFVSLCLIKLKSNLNIRFVYYFFRSHEIKEQIYGQIKQSTVINLHLDKIENFEIALPLLEEQIQIANFLDHETAKIDILIDKQQQLIKLLKEKRQAVISHAVTKGLNPDAPMKDSGVEWLGEVPAHWNVSRLGFHTTKIGSGKTPKGGAEIYQDSGVLFLRSQNVYDDGLRIAKSESVYINESIHHEMAGSSVQDGDVLLNITGGSIGRSCLVPSNFPDANVNQHVCILRFPTSIHEFFSFVMKSNSIKEQINAFQTGGNREGLNFEQISKLKFTLPPLDEINFIIDHIKSITFTFNTLEEQAQQAINLIHERRTALISAAVTGKIDVRYPVSPPTGNAENEYLEQTI